jgi:cell division protein FtsB
MALAFVQAGSSSMRWPLVLIAALLLFLQYPLWLGKGGWLRVWEVDTQLSERREVNRRLEQRNAALAAEVEDLKSGNEAIEERARFDLGLTRPGEVFVQVPEGR